MTILDPNNKLASLRVDSSGRLLVDGGGGGGGASLPSQTGNAGRVLTTDGTNPSWALANTFVHVGTWAGRPSAASAGAGANMITTDTFRRTQWYSDGSDWFPLGGETLIYSLQAQLVGAISTNPTLTLPTPVIPGGMMGTFGELFVDIGFQYSSNTASAVSENVSFGGVNFIAATASPTNRGKWHLRSIKNTSATAQLIPAAFVSGGTGASGSAALSASVNTAANVSMGGTISATDATSGFIQLVKYNIFLRK